MFTDDLFNNPYWQELRPYSKYEAWLSLYEQGRQFLVSQRTLAKQWRWTERQVRTFIANLEKKGEISISIERNGRAITMLCYDDMISNLRKQLTKMSKAKNLYKNISTDPPSDPPTDPHFDPPNNLDANELSVAATHTLTHQVTHQVTHQTIEQNKAKLEKRAKEFYASLVPYLELYDKAMLREFYDYWSEPNKSFSLMRYEKETTWEVGRRLTTWDKRNKQRYGRTYEDRRHHEQQQRLDAAEQGIDDILNGNI